MTLTQSSLPLCQLWSGRLQLSAFQSTLHSQNAQLGPLGYGGMEGFRPTRQSYPGGPLSVHFSGFSLNFHFSRDSRTRYPTQVWRRLKRFVGTAPQLNWIAVVSSQLASRSDRLRDHPWVRYLGISVHWPSVNRRGELARESWSCLDRGVHRHPHCVPDTMTDV